MDMVDFQSEYKGYTITLKKDFGNRPFLINGRYISLGFVVVKEEINPMPGGAWFESERQAQDAIDCLITSKGDIDKFWYMMRRDSSKTPNKVHEDLKWILGIFQEYTKERNTSIGVDDALSAMVNMISFLDNGSFPVNFASELKWVYDVMDGYLYNKEVSDEVKSAMGSLKTLSNAVNFAEKEAV